MKNKRLTSQVVYIASSDGCHCELSEAISIPTNDIAAARRPGLAMTSTQRKYYRKLAICCIFIVLLGLPVLSFANNESETNNEAQQRFEKANELRKIKDYDGAIAEYNNVLNLSPDDKTARNAQYWIGQSHFEAKRFDAALSAFEKLLDKYPTSTIIPSTKQMIECVQQAKKNKSLCEAAYKGEVERVKQLIAEGADVNGKGVKGKTPLLCATSTGHLNVVKVLLENGAKVDFGGGKYTPLFHPIWDDNIDIEMVRTFITSGADVNVRPEGGNDTPLFYAVFYRRSDIAKILIDAGADVNVEIEDGLTPLHIALLRAYPEMVRQFVGTGVKIPAFHNVVLEGDLAGVKRLVEGGMDVDTPDKFDWTPACWAVSAGRKEIAEYLLSQGADITVKMEKGLTLLHQASTSGLVEIVKSLISKGSEVNVKCEAGRTPLQYAAASGQIAVVELLIANGATINFTANDGTHPLGDAALYGHEDVVKLLLASGAEVNLGSKGRGTALNAAAVSGNSTIIDILIAHGVDVNAVSKNGAALGLTASILDSRTTAADNRRAKIAQKLLDHGADVNVKHPRSGVTPLYGAVVLGRYRTAEVLIAAGADVNATDNEGKTLLSLAKEAGHAEIVELLRKHGAKE